MVQTCSKCSRANPADAVYCYFDGIELAEHGPRSGPIAAGSRSFARPFVFPNGRTCRTFNELALACQEEWSAAADLLQQGYLATFLAGVGRADLARAAHEAAAFPDRDRGLDQLLTKLPADVLADPKLRLAPLEFNLGVLEVGAERTFDLHLENQGMRLLYGSVSCADDVWLTLGDVPGAADKHFQFTHELTVSVRVRGDRLRARNKPVEARLVVESNGGSFTVVVRAEVPVKAFAVGVLAGAKSPRQVAEKCQANPKDAAPLFEQGEVEKWYAANGWTYPVTMPAASGLAAVQQFFEALGVTKPPRVEINKRALAFQANPGDSWSETLEVRSQEKRPVYAHATSSAPWLEVGRPSFNGRVASIDLVVPAVPNKPGQTLHAQLTVQSNGNQRFVVPLTVEVAGNFNFTDPDPEPEAEVTSAAVTADVKPPPLPTGPRKPGKGETDKPPEPPPLRGRRGERRKGTPAWLHAVPAGLLALAVLAVVALDLVARKPKDDPEGLRDQEGWRYDVAGLKDKRAQLGVQFNPDMRFGLLMLGVKDPENKDRPKRLTASEQGNTNNTIVNINGSEYKFGYVTPTNRWMTKRKQVPLREPRIGWISEMNFSAEHVRVLQHVEVVPGQTGLLDTVLVYYKVHNRGTIPRKVGLRVMIDTFIGSNDGVPFTVPGRTGFVTKKEDFAGGKVPDYIEAVENPDNPSDPGTTVRLGLRGIELPNLTLDEPDRLRICGFPGANAGWEWDAADLGNDSCVAVYWEPRDLEAGAARHLAFTYGLSKLEVGDLLALSCPSSVLPNRGFVVTAYVWNARKGQKITLEVPEGLRLEDGESAAKTIEENAVRTQVFWRLKSGAEGTFTLEATSGKSKARPRPVEVKRSSIFG
jgi:hypothetical protein